MQDKPQSWELLEAIQTLLMKEVLPRIKEDDLLSYKTLVSWNMLGVVGREIQVGEELLELELESLSHLLKEKNTSKELNFKQKTEVATKLNQKLTKKIKTESISDTSSTTWKHVKENLKRKLQISNPRFSLH